MGDWKEQLAAVRVRLETATQQGVAMTTESKTRLTLRPQITLAQKIAIHRDLESALERIEGEVSNRGDKPLPKWRYKDGQSDATIASKHGVGEAAVGALRLELFGALQRSDYGVSRPGMFELQASLKRITEQLADFARRVERLEDAITSPDSLDRQREIERHRISPDAANGNGHYPKLV